MVLGRSWRVCVCVLLAILLRDRIMLQDSVTGLSIVSWGEVASFAIHAMDVLAGLASVAAGFTHVTARKRSALGL